MTTCPICGDSAGWCPKVADEAERCITTMVALHPPIDEPEGSGGGEEWLARAEAAYERQVYGD